MRIVVLGDHDPADPTHEATTAAPGHGAGLHPSAVDALGEVRAVELPDLPFHVGTLFVLQASSTPKRPHPLVTALVVAAAERARR